MLHRVVFDIFHLHHKIYYYTTSRRFIMFSTDFGSFTLGILKREINRKSLGKKTDSFEILIFVKITKWKCCVLLRSHSNVTSFLSTKKFSFFIYKFLLCFSTFSFDYFAQLNEPAVLLLWHKHWDSSLLKMRNNKKKCNDEYQ